MFECKDTKTLKTPVGLNLFLHKRDICLMEGLMSFYSLG